MFPENLFYLLIALVVIMLIIILLVVRNNKRTKSEMQGMTKNQQLLQKINDDFKKQITSLRTKKTDKATRPEFFNTTSNGIVITDNTGEILEMNDGFTNSFGFTKETFIERYGTNYKQSSSYPKAIDEAINSKRNVNFPSVRENSEGEQIWINTEVCPIIDKTGIINKLYFLETDINLYKIIETEILQQRDEVEIEKTKAEMQRDKMQNKYKGFSDSVNYARRIQKAILPSDQSLKQLFSEHFVLYQPRDVVSGDFYWVSEKGSKKIIVAADCTGHGVPGAFMSILGINFLNEIISKHRKISAAGILDKLRSLVIEALNNQQDNEEAKDGIDLGLCIFDLEKKTLQFAGANNSLYLIRNRELNITKGDRMPVGIHPKMHLSFTNKEIELLEGDAIYMFTDGYVDQFGWRNGKKFKTRQFQEQLIQLQDIPMKGQRIILENTISNWKGDLEQVDDILVMGIKI